MKHNIKSIRTFIGAKNFKESRNFYTLIGFEESVISDSFSYFQAEGFGFYLQDYYVKKWINNSMIFLEVDNVERYLSELTSLELNKKFKNVRLTPIKNEDWGKEFFMHDPSGILWHFGEFKN